MSSAFVILMIGAGAFTLALGIVHLSIPRLVGYRAALGASRADLPTLRLLGLTFRLRPDDLIGLTWVMSNAASCVLITIGLLDLAWASGWRGLSIGLGDVDRGLVGGPGGRPVRGRPANR